MIKVAQWINPYGKIIDLGPTKHIDAVISNPEKFMMSRDDIFSTYKKYGERVGQEGKAREEIIVNLLKKGFIRIRLYNNYWSINVGRWTPQVKKALSKWAEKEKDNKWAGPDMPVVIDMPNRVIRDYTVKDLYYDKHLYEGETFFPKWFDPMWVESIDEFEEIPPSFIDSL